MKHLKATKVKNGWYVELTDVITVGCTSDVYKIIREFENEKRSDKECIFHLLWMLIQYCYTSETSGNNYKSRYNACANSTDYLSKLGYVKILKGSWPKTKFIEFELTERGLKLIDSVKYI